MKKSIFILSLASVQFFSAIESSAQTNFGVSGKGTRQIATNDYNKWSFEIDGGMAKPVRPFETGYFMLRGKDNYAGIQFNHIGLGVRHMLNPLFGFKSHLSLDRIHNFDNSISKEFSVYYSQLSIEGVINAVRLFQLNNSNSRWGLLIHGGFQLCTLSPDMGTNQGKTEMNAGMLVGLTPQFRIGQRFSLFYDVVAQANVSQHFNWDGSSASYGENATATLFSNAIGLSISLGKNKIHGDFANVPNPNNKELNDLKERVAMMEIFMKDADKDGVPDYLDEEKNSLPGAMVDTKGRMLDKNNNNIPDYVEGYLNNQPVASVHTDVSTNSIIEQMINDGYVAAYFDFNQSKPTNNSTSDIAFVYRFMKNNPTKALEVIGYADIIGSNQYNQKLSEKRAEEIKSMLVKGGIEASRISTKGASSDNSVDKNNSEEARRLVRRVYFKIK